MTPVAPALALSRASAGRVGAPGHLNSSVHRLGRLGRLAHMVVAATICALLSAGFSPGPSAGLSAGLSAGAADESQIIDAYSAYEPQTRCAKTTQPGTALLLTWLIRTYPATRPSSTIRPCVGTGTSEHKDGRALDWAVDANRPAQRAIADRFLARIFATDLAGNPHALARRMGIMYVIWNDHTWASYRQFERRDYLSSGCRTRKSCSKTLRHRDHVHISLSRAGAASLTSFYLVP